MKKIKKNKGNNERIEAIPALVVLRGQKSRKGSRMNLGDGNIGHFAKDMTKSLNSDESKDK